MFENCAKYNGWKDGDKVAHLRWSLTGIAAQLLWDTSDLKYKELVEKLKGRFGGKGMEEKFQNELRYRRRGKGEGLRELAQDVRRLMALAYPGERSSLAEHIARDSFLSALDDSELELRIREHDPVDLDAAVKMALRFEVFRGVMEASSSGRHRVTRHVVRDSPESDPSEKIETRVLDLERQLNELKRQPQTRSDDDSQPASKGDADRVQISGKRNRNVQKSSKGQDGDRAEGVQVDSSGPLQKKDEQIAQLMAEMDVLNREVGRLKCLEQQRNDAALATATASQLINPNAVTAPGAPVRQTGGCWKCGMVGHFSRNCPMKWQYSQRPAAGSSTAFQCSGAKKATRDLQSGATYLRVLIAGQERDCLLDTGSETSLLPASMVDPGFITRTSHTLRAANGTTIPVLGEATVPLHVGHSSTTVTALVSDHIAEVMLGVDWLEENRIVWDFNSAAIWMNGECLKLQSAKKEQRWCRRTILQKEVTIPPRSQMDLPAKVIFNGRPDAEEAVDWATEPVYVAEGVYLARTLLPGKQFTDVPVRAVNMKTSPVTLPAGTHLSILHPSFVVTEVSKPEGGASHQGPTSRVTDTSPGKEQSVAFIEQLVQTVHGSVPSDVVSSLKQLLMRYADVFSTAEHVKKMLKQVGWLEQMEDFNFTVEYRPGQPYGNADALSRRPCTKTVRVARVIRNQIFTIRRMGFPLSAGRPIGPIVRS
jgi:hypothetical protein